MKPLWFARKRDVSTLFILFWFISVHPISPYISPLPLYLSLPSSGKTEFRPTFVEQNSSSPVDDVVRPGHRPNHGPRTGELPT